MAAEIITLLESYKYRPAGSCQCDGLFTLKYRREGGYEVRWRKKSYSFKIKRNNETIKNWNQLALLKIHLEEIHGSLETATQSVPA